MYPFRNTTGASSFRNFSKRIFQVPFLALLLFNFQGPLRSFRRPFSGRSLERLTIIPNPRSFVNPFFSLLYTPPRVPREFYKLLCLSPLNTTISAKVSFCFLSIAFPSLSDQKRHALPPLPVSAQNLRRLGRDFLHRLAPLLVPGLFSLYRGTIYFEMIKNAHEKGRGICRGPIAETVYIYAFLTRSATRSPISTVLTFLYPSS